MPPKRPARQATPPSTKKSKKSTKPVQPSIDSFFASPTKPKLPTKSSIKRGDAIISIDDSDDEILPGSPINQEVQDAKLARKLADEWANGAGLDLSNGDKGKEKSKSPESIDGIQDMGTPRTGVNGSSSSKQLLDPVKLEPTTSPKKEAKPVHPMFASPNKKRAASPTPIRDVKADRSSPPDVKPSTITSTSADPVEPINLDTDAFLFRPGDIDISNWPKGRLPYSVLVGVYVQVSSTRSRLTIVRVLTKYA